MAIKGIVFDIGNVLEYTPDLGIHAEWERRLGLPAGAIGERIGDLWAQGSVGAITLDDVHAGIRARMGWSAAQVDSFMEDIWREYVGTLNRELAAYFAGLRPRFRTGILSNSFVGAREREQALYGFEQMCDVIVYSHEVGMSKPDPRIYALTCERLGLRPDEVVFLDDREVAVEGARAAGMHAIRFEDNAQAIAAIERCTADNA